MMILRAVSASFLAGVLGFVDPGVSWAGLQICNDTSEEHSVAIGYKQDGEWFSEGWWTIPVGDCQTPVSSDLKNQFYYYSSRSRGWKFTDDNISFCIDSTVFSITGDEDCAQRGYEQGHFAEIDTGTSARNFVQNLSAHMTQDAASGSLAGPPGTHGEPYAEDVVFQDCALVEEGESYCSFHSRGTKFFVADDGRTPGAVFTYLRSLTPGAPLFVNGDLTGIFDTTAEVVLRQAEPRQWQRSDAMLGRMQGYWYAVEDPSAQFNILGAERENNYDGEPDGVEYLSLSQSCNSFEGAGPYLYARNEQTGEGYCYAVDYVDEFVMRLIYLPRGNLLEYRKLN